MENTKISVVINTYNAALYLHEVINSVKDFDEIVVCDMESTDDTVKIAREKGCKVVTFIKGDISICEPARNFAIQSAQYDWVLVVDADEIVTPALRSYLYERLSRGNCPEGLYIPRRNMFMGRNTHSSPDYQLRFLKKDRTDWPPIIHRPPHINGRVEKIPNNLKGVHLKHLDDANMTNRLSKLNTYTDYEVEKRQHKQYGWGALVLRPFWFFIRCYFIQGAIRDGMRGLIRAYMSSFYQVILLSKIRECQWGNKQYENDCK